MDLRLILCAAGILLGAAITWSGLRLVAPPARRPATHGAKTSRAQSFTVSGAGFMIFGIALIAISVQTIIERQHEIDRAVRPTSFMNLDAPPIPIEDIKPPSPESPFGH
jgi:hypothetical protein